MPTPPSSLNMDRHGSAARTGRAEIAESLADHASMTPAITGGDVDADIEDAYFSGDEAPGGDNPTPDQDIVDDIGKALGVEYQDNEELRASDKVAERDKNRWELDPASAEDYRDSDKDSRQELGIRNSELGIVTGIRNSGMLIHCDSVRCLVDRVHHQVDHFRHRSARRVDHERVRGRIQRRHGAGRDRAAIALGQQRRDVGDRAPARRCAPGRWRGGGRARRPTRRDKSSRRRRETPPCRCPAPPSRCRRRRRSPADVRPGSSARAAAAQPPPRRASISGVRIARVTSCRRSSRRRRRSRCAAGSRAAPPPLPRRAAMPSRERLPADGAVHRAAVDVPVAELVGDCPRHRAFAGAGRPVDGDDQLTHACRILEPAITVGTSRRPMPTVSSLIDPSRIACSSTASRR